MLWSRSRAEHDFFVGAGAKKPALGGCCVTLRWQSCDNSFKCSQIITIFTRTESKKNTLLKSKIIFFLTGRMNLGRSRSRLERLHNTGSMETKILEKPDDFTFFSFPLPVPGTVDARNSGQRT